MSAKYNTQTNTNSVILFEHIQSSRAKQYIAAVCVLIIIISIFFIYVLASLANQPVTVQTTIAMLIKGGIISQANATKLIAEANGNKFSTQNYGNYSIVNVTIVNPFSSPGANTVGMGVLVILWVFLIGIIIWKSNNYYDEGTRELKSRFGIEG